MCLQLFLVLLLLYLGILFISVFPDLTLIRVTFHGTGSMYPIEGKTNASHHVSSSFLWHFLALSIRVCIKFFWISVCMLEIWMLNDVYHNRIFRILFNDMKSSVCENWRAIYWKVVKSNQSWKRKHKRIRDGN